VSAADEFGHFCSQLTLEDGRRLMRVEPFQREVLAGYFEGARESLIIIPKKNGKSSLIAALALFHVLFGPKAAECVVAAASRDQAGILLRQARGFIDRSEKLGRWLIVRDREILTPDKRSRIRILAADADTADGVLPTLAVVDELHRQRSADLYGVFRDGLGPRGGQLISISTAGESEASVLGEMRAAARRLPTLHRDGKHLQAESPDGQFVYHEWSLEPDDDRDDLEVVKQANPASWQTLEELRLRKDSPSTLPWQWARFACGLWVGESDWWITGEVWADLATDDHLRPGDRITLGFDGSRVLDATALVGCRLTDGLVEPLGLWAPPAESADWEVPAGAVDARLAEIMERFTIVRMYADPPLWQSEIDAWAREFGEQVVMRFPTARPRMMGATERFRTDVLAGRLRHGGDRDLTRHVLAARVREARGGYFLAKSRPSAPDKIDAAVAAVLAWEARADAIAAGLDRPKKKGAFFF
jgi:phage terminase large subunit-like protein